MALLALPLVAQTPARLWSVRHSAMGRWSLSRSNRNREGEAAIYRDGVKAEAGRRSLREFATRKDKTRGLPWLPRTTRRRISGARFPNRIDDVIDRGNYYFRLIDDDHVGAVFGDALLRSVGQAQKLFL